MKHGYRVISNRDLRLYQVASENTRSRSKRSRTAKAAMTLAGLALTTSAAFAAGQGGYQGGHVSPDEPGIGWNDGMAGLTAGRGGGENGGDANGGKGGTGIATGGGGGGSSGGRSW